MKPEFLMPRRWRWLFLWPLSLCFVAPAWAQKPVAFVPDDPQTVIERLPRGYAALRPPPRDSAPTATLIQAQALLAAAARSGDARLVGRADALLAHHPGRERDPAVLRLRAYSAQHGHDFAQALRLLDRVIAIEPRAADARLSRAQLHLVGGRVTEAHADCVALALGIDAGDGLLCAAMVSLRRGRYAVATAAVDDWLRRDAETRVRTGAATDIERRRFVETLGAEVAARAGADDADARFRRALALAPDDVRTLAAYARHLRRVGRAREAEALLRGHEGHDGLRLQRALALRAIGTADALRATQVLADGLARSYAQTRAVGREPELRDEAEFLLRFRGDAAGALRLAQRNFADQRDAEDVELLVCAAQAAHRPEALAPLRAWAAAEAIALPATKETQR
jgi:Tfp pilus assembly protein PilF